MFVMDASVALAWVKREDPHAEKTQALAPRITSERIVAPFLFWYELRSVLIQDEREGRLSYGQAESFLADVAQLDLALVFDHDEAAVLGLARRRRLSVYDAAYLETAMRLGAPLATFDGRMAAAAEREGVADAMA